MHVISRKALRTFWDHQPDSKAPLCRWLQIVEQSKYRSFAELRRTFPSADKVDHFVVFNIAGNKYRLIAAIHFNRSRIYIRHVLTHKAYDQGEWKT